MLDIVFQGFDFRLIGGNLLVAFVGVEFQNTAHLDFEKPHDIVVGNLAEEIFYILFEPAPDMGDSLLAVLGLFVAFFLVDAFFNENALEGGEMELLAHLAELDFEFGVEYGAGALHAVAKHVGDTEEMRLVVGNHAAVGRHRNLAVGECVESVDGAV